MVYFLIGIHDCFARLRPNRGGGRGQVVLQNGKQKLLRYVIAVESFLGCKNKEKNRLFHCIFTSLLISITKQSPNKLLLVVYHLRQSLLSNHVSTFLVNNRILAGTYQLCICHNLHLIRII